MSVDVSDLFRFAALRAAIRLHVRTNGQVRADRRLTPTRLLDLATEYTGTKYRRGQHAQALADLDALHTIALASTTAGRHYRTLAEARAEFDAEFERYTTPATQEA